MSSCFSPMVLSCGTYLPLFLTYCSQNHRLDSYKDIRVKNRLKQSVEVKLLPWICCPQRGKPKILKHKHKINYKVPVKPENSPNARRADTCIPRALGYYAANKEQRKIVEQDLTEFTPIPKISIRTFILISESIHHLNKNNEETKETVLRNKFKYSKKV